MSMPLAPLHALPVSPRHASSPQRIRLGRPDMPLPHALHVSPSLDDLPLPEPVAQSLDPTVYGLPLRRHAEAVAPGFVDVQLGRPPGVPPRRVEADAAGLRDGVVGGTED